jgi:hypothetical protein
MGTGTSRILRYLINFLFVSGVEAVAFSFLLNTEGYTWMDEFLNVLPLCIIWNVVNFAIFMTLFKLAFKRSSLLLQGLVTACLGTALYFLLLSFTYIGGSLRYKIAVVLVCFFIGSFLIPFIDNWIMIRHRVK